MKKLLVLMMSLTMALSLAACGSKPAQTSDSATSAEKDAGEAVQEAQTAAAESTAADAKDEQPGATDSDLDYVKEKGKLVVGITDFEPMDYKDANGEWIGFDADMAKAFAKSLGVEAEFIEIQWDSKILELQNKTIDCVWNGMTLTDEVKSGMDCSKPYFNNAQVVVLPKDKAEQYKDKDSLSGLTFAVERGSAGAKEVEALGLQYKELDVQADTLMEVASGTSDAAVIDFLMAVAMTGEGTGYADLTYTVRLNSEEYGVGFRKGSDLASTLNDFFVASYKDGSMAKCAETYRLQDALIAQ